MQLDIKREINQLFDKELSCLVFHVK